MATITNAVSAYTNAGQSFAADGMAARDVQPKPLPGQDFAQVLNTAARESIQSLKEAESLSAAAIAGKADIREVVAAVSNAEMTLETVVNVRDKVVNAYNEIIRMPI